LGHRVYISQLKNCVHLRSNDSQSQDISQGPRLENDHLAAPQIDTRHRDKLKKYFFAFYANHLVHLGLEPGDKNAVLSSIVP